MADGWIDWDKPRTICCCITISPKGKTWIKRLLIAWLTFAIVSKLLAVYIFATVDYATLWQEATSSVLSFFHGNSSSCSELSLSTAFGVDSLGNLMFQYASLYGMSRKLCRKPVIPQLLPLNYYFSLDSMKSNSSRPGQQWLQFPEHRASSYDYSLVSHLEKNKQDAELVGFFQSWFYFRSSFSDIRKQFKLKSPYHDEVEHIRAEIFEKAASGGKSVHPTLVGVHVRRGDMTNEQFVHHGYTTATLQYFENAMSWMESKHRNIIYVVCSDDLTWCQQNLNSTARKIYFSKNHSDIVDMGLLASCDHTILTVGTFGWWAGFLAHGDTIYYKDYPQPYSNLWKAFSKDKADYYPPLWVGLS